MKIIAPLIVGLSLLASPALALNVNADIVGYGRLECSKWTTARQSNKLEERLLQTWIAGYMTSFNEWNGISDAMTGEQKKQLKDDPSVQKYLHSLEDIGSVESPENFFSHVDIYCRNNPQSLIAAAVFDTTMKIIERIEETRKKDYDEDFQKTLNDVMKKK